MIGVRLIVLRTISLTPFWLGNLDPHAVIAVAEIQLLPTETPAARVHGVGLGLGLEELVRCMLE